MTLRLNWWLASPGRYLDDGKACDVCSGAPGRELARAGCLPVTEPSVCCKLLECPLSWTDPRQTGIAIG